jgi:hypothetical protein
MCSSADRTASQSGSQIGGSECGTVVAAGLTGLTPHDLRHTAASLADRVWRVGETRTADARPQGRGDDIECLRVAVEDDLDDVSNRLDAALLEAAAACVRPEPSAEIIELPERTSRTAP